MVEQPVDNHAGDGNVDPDRPGPAGDAAMAVKTAAQRQVRVMITIGRTTMARMVCVVRSVRYAGRIHPVRENN